MQRSPVTCLESVLALHRHVSVRASVGMLAAIVAVFLPLERVVSDDRPSVAVTARGITFPYRDTAFFVVAQRAGDDRSAWVSVPFSHAGRARSGSRGVGRPEPVDMAGARHAGRYELKIDGVPGSDQVEMTAFVMVSASAVKQGLLNGYRIGDYPAKPLRGDPIYLPPAGFIEVTDDNEDARVSPNFRLKQFLSHQASDFPKYLVLNEGLIVALELIGRALEPLNLDADDIHVMSGFRTPFYNRAIGNVEYSLHQWGRAADIFIDHDGNGTMDDLNQDKKIDRADAQFLYDLLDRLSKTVDGSLIGGLSVYDRTATHGPFVHVDVRTRKVRW